MSFSKVDIGEYEVNISPKYRLGKGSFGSVYKGNHKQTDKQVAIKRIELEQEDDDRAIFMELTSMDNLQEHRNVVQLLDAQFGECECWIVMELCQGDLQGYLKANKHKLDIGDKVHLMCQAISPIAFMHGLSPPIIHRDIKPGNFLYQMDDKGEVTLKVTDFGLAKLYDRENASETMKIFSDTMCGTLHYMAPEFWVEGTLSYGNTVDNFALGLMCYVILEADKNSKDLPYSVKSKRDGILSYIGNEMQIAHKQRKPMPNVVEFIDSDSTDLNTIKQLIVQMIVFNPEERWPLSNVEEELCHLAVQLKKEVHPLPPLMIQRELSNLTVDPGPDSGIGASTSDHHNIPDTPDSIGYAMMRSVPLLLVDSGLQTLNPFQGSLIEQLQKCLLQSGSSYGSVFQLGDGKNIKCGDVVRIDGDEKKVKQVQGHSWDDNMKQGLGLPGVVTGVEDDQARVRCINQKSYVVKTKVLHKEELDPRTMCGGDYVVVKQDKNFVKQLQEKEGGWVKAMEKQIGKPGIVRCPRKNRIKVEHGGKANFVWCRNALILVAKGDEVIKILLSQKQ